MKDGYWCSKHCSKGRLANWAKVGVDQHLQINIFTLSLFLSQIKDSTISFTLTFQITLFLLNYRVSWQIEHYTCESIYLFFIYTFTVHFMKWGFGILIYTYNTCSNNYCYILFFSKLSTFRSQFGPNFKFRSRQLLLSTRRFTLQNYIIISVQLQGMLANWARQTDRWMNLLKLNPPASAGLKECTDVGTNLSGAFSGLDSWIQSSMNFVSILIWDICIDILSYILFYEYILFYISSYILYSYFLKKCEWGS